MKVPIANGLLIKPAAPVLRPYDAFIDSSVYWMVW